MSEPRLFILGATHHTAPLEVRERLALAPEAEAALRHELRAVAGLRELAVLNTCNRVEFYGVAEGPEPVAAVQAAFCARQRFEAEQFERFRLSLAGADAVRHLFEVAAGIDSQMVGENEIFGQVKDAYAAAQAAGSAGPVLNRLFQKAFQAAKHVRTHTAITQGPVSVANVAVELAAGIFGRLEGARLLLIGAGEIGEKAAKAFRSRGAGALTVASRRLERAMELASQLGASAMPFEQCEARLAEFDVVACASSAGSVLGAAAVAAAMRKRPARPLLVVDLALPRNVDPAAADLDNVFLYNLDDLARAAEENRRARQAETERGRVLLADRAAALWGQLGPRMNAPAGGPPASAVEVAKQPVGGRPAGGLAQ